MTPSEFKSWFAVFSEAVDGTPTPRQWAKIQKRVDEMVQPTIMLGGQHSAVNVMYQQGLYGQITGK